MRHILPLFCLLLIPTLAHAELSKGKQKKFDDLFEQVMTSLQANDFPATAKLADKALKLNPGHPGVTGMRGVARWSNVQMAFIDVVSKQGTVSEDSLNSLKEGLKTAFADLVFARDNAPSAEERQGFVETLDTIAHSYDGNPEPLVITIAEVQAALLAEMGIQITPVAAPETAPASPEGEAATPEAAPAVDESAPAPDSAAQ